MGSILVRMKSDFTFHIFVNLNLDISLKLKNGLNKFLNRWKLYPQRVMGTLDVMEFTGGILKLGVKMDWYFDMFIRATDRDIPYSW